eukprot:TRINITY_DN7788_c0_g1_i1.p1 TRINITY_DN7788_c0_g1~~TRINITY_DN7788_c0_g1_i1.p1  ORF type:complete len:791 (+),score=188.43 TRINITY_DN7788_c0_g1_i1:3339-5711(+)
MRLLFLLALFCSTIHGAVIGIDLGSEFLKVGVVKSGHGAIDIVLNEQTNRKTPNFVGFRGDERYLGEDAFQLSPRFPSNMLTYVNHLVGLEYNDDALKTLQEKLRLPFQFVNNSARGTIDLKVGPEEVYTAEELLAMLFSYLKKMSENHAEQPVTDAVVVIPAATTTRQRQAILDAAKMANLNILSLMDVTTAVALQYGVQRRGFGESFNQTNVVIFDIGASKLEVGVFGFFPPVNVSGKKVKTAEAFGTLKVLSIASDNTVGGRHFDSILVNRFAEEYAKSSGNRVLEMNNLNGYKAWVKLFRSAKKAKETLSANKDVQVPVEGIYDEKDFITQLSRSQFLEVTDHLIDKAVDAVRRALEQANLSVDEISSLELMGGGSRIPALQDKLAAYVKNLGKTLNTDEAAALGGAFYAARLSGSFRVKGFGVVTQARHNVSFQLSASSAVPSPAPRVLFAASRLPSKKQVTLGRMEDFNVTLSLASGGEAAPLLTYELDGVSEAFSKLGVNKYNDSEAKGTVSLKFTLSESGLVALDSASARYVYHVNVTKKVPVKVNVTSPVNTAQAENATAADAGAEKPADDDEDAEETAAAPPAPPAAANATGTNATNATTTKTEYREVTELKERVATEQLKWTVHQLLTPLPAGAEELKSAQATLKRLRQRDEEKAALAEAKNNLETYVFHLKYESPFASESAEGPLTEEEKQKVTDAVKEVETWLEDEGYAASKEELRSRLHDLKTVVRSVEKKDEPKAEVNATDASATNETAKADEAAEEGTAASASPESEEEPDEEL